MNLEFIEQEGRKRVVMDYADYENLLDARDHAVAMASVQAGAPTFSGKERDDYLAAPTPLAFWRKRSGKTQAELAGEVGVSQPFLAQIEGGKRAGGVGVLARVARALNVRLDDLVEIASA